MEKRKQYTISDLVTELDIARSTVNDWLSRYAQYIDFEIQGKRKIFFDSSLNVLKEIAELRDAGQASHEIAVSLAERHPLQAEVAAPEEGGNGKFSSDQLGKTASAEVLVPVLRRQTEEFGKLLGSRLEDISMHIENTDRQSALAVRRLRLWGAAALLLFVIVSAVAVAAAMKLNSVLEEQRIQILGNRDKLGNQNRQLAGELARHKQTVSGQAEKLEKLTVVLDKNSADYIRNIELLRSGMQEQQEKFANMLEADRNDAEKQKTAELAREKNEFARRRLEILKEKEQLAAELKAKEQKIEELRKQLEQNNITIRNLSEAGKAQAPLKIPAVSVPGKIVPAKPLPTASVPAKTVLETDQPKGSR